MTIEPELNLYKLYADRYLLCFSSETSDLRHTRYRKEQFQAFPDREPILCLVMDTANLFCFRPTDKLMNRIDLPTQMNAA